MPSAEMTVEGHVGHTANYQEAYATGTGAIDHVYRAPSGKVMQIEQLMLHFNTAPTTAQDWILTVQKWTGATYHTVIINRDPGTESIADLFLDEDDFGKLKLLPGDLILITYTNTDGRTWGVSVLLEEK